MAFLLLQTIILQNKNRCVLKMKNTPQQKQDEFKCN